MKKISINKNKYLILSLIVVSLGIFFVIAKVSYSFFTAQVAGKKYIVYTGNLEVQYEKVSNVINLQDTYPLTNEQGLLTPAYTFKVKNTGTLEEKYQVRLELSDDTNIPVEYIKVAINKNGNEYLKPTLLSHLNSNLVVIDDGLLNVNSNDTYDLRLWIDYGADNSVVGKTFKARIIIDAMQNVADGYKVNTRPIITLNDSDSHLNTNDTYNDPGIKEIRDDNDTLSTSDASISWEYYDGTNLTPVVNIDTSVNGIYYETYSVTDSSNLEGKSVRVVTVNAPGTIPTITLNGSNMSITEGDTFVDPGVTTTAQVITIGEVKTNVGGVYTLKYIAVDNNKMNSVTRTVTVVPKYRESLLAGAYPVLTDNLVPVTIDNDGTVHKADITSNWYSYQNKNWANAVVLKQAVKGDQIIDLSGHGNDATIHGATLTNEGLVFDGIDDYAVTNDVIDYNSTKELTIEFEAKLTDSTDIIQ